MLIYTEATAANTPFTAPLLIFSRISPWIILTDSLAYASQKKQDSLKASRLQSPTLLPS